MWNAFEVRFGVFEYGTGIFHGDGFMRKCWLVVRLSDLNGR
jgi:hypothetical protein